MDKNSTGIKKKIAMAAVLVGAVLSILTFLFIHEVKEELWKQSVQTIIESTQQGCNTLKVQLMDDYQSMGTVTLNLREFLFPPPAGYAAPLPLRPYPASSSPQ